MIAKLKTKVQALMATAGIWLISNSGKRSDVALYAVPNDKSIILVDVSKGEAAVKWSAEDDVSMIFGGAVTDNNFQRILLTSSFDVGNDSVKECRKIMKNGVASGHVDRMYAVLGQMRGTTFPHLRTPKISDLH